MYNNFLYTYSYQKIIIRDKKPNLKMDIRSKGLKLKNYVIFFSLAVTPKTLKHILTIRHILLRIGTKGTNKTKNTKEKESELQEDDDDDRRITNVLIFQIDSHQFAIQIQRLNHKISTT